MRHGLLICCAGSADLGTGGLPDWRRVIRPWKLAACCSCCRWCTEGGVRQGEVLLGLGMMGAAVWAAYCAASCGHLDWRRRCTDGGGGRQDAQRGGDCCGLLLERWSGLPCCCCAREQGWRETPGVVWQGEEAGWKVEKDDWLG